MKAWLRFFRVVNLPTVPGDVLVGAAVVIASVPSGVISRLPSGEWIRPADDLTTVAWAALASVFAYLFGLALNDVLGAKTDKGRPIPEGLISLRSAKIAGCVCLFVVPVIGFAAKLPHYWWSWSGLLVGMIILYNRTKWWWVMGLCRACNVLCGAAVLWPRWSTHDNFRSFAVAVFWWLYISLVTLYSEGEETDPAKKRRVGFLIGAIVYLQLIALLIFRVDPLLLTGAGLLVVLRLMKRFLPEVSAS